MTTEQKLEILEQEGYSFGNIHIGECHWTLTHYDDDRLVTGTSRYTHNLSHPRDTGDNRAALIIENAWQHRVNTKLIRSKGGNVGSL